MFSKNLEYVSSQYMIAVINDVTPHPPPPPPVLSVTLGPKGFPFWLQLKVNVLLLFFPLIYVILKYLKSLEMPF